MLFLVERLTRSQLAAAEELAKYHAYETFWSERVIPTAAAAMPLVSEAHNLGTDPLALAERVVDLIPRCRVWRGAWL